MPSTPITGNVVPIKPDSDARPVTAASLGVISRRLSDVPMRPIMWLWSDRIPLGKVSMLSGNPGLGKSQVCASIAAIVTTGGQWPVSRDRAPIGSVVILSAEDDAEDTIGPRMDAAGADCSKIHILDAIKIIDERGTTTTRGFDITHDIQRLCVLMDEIGDVRLVIIDPISAYMGILDTHKNSDVRGALSQLTHIAAQIGAAIIIVNHLNKATGQEALLKSQGSVGFVAAARAVWGVAKDKDDPHRRLFMPLKNNLGTDESGLAYSIEGWQLTDSEIKTSRVMWESAPVELSAEEVFSAPVSGEEKSSFNDAKDFLRAALEPGWMLTKDLQHLAREAGHAWATVRRARDAIGAVSAREGGFGSRGKWGWQMPAPSGHGLAHQPDPIPAVDL